MNAIAALIATIFAGAAILFLSPAIGYVIGWGFGWLFNDTWASMKLWLDLPPNVTSGMFFAFVCLVGSMFKSNLTTSK